MKVFISGSIELINPSKARDLIPSLLSQNIVDNDILLIGDCDGFDRLVQEYLASEGYKRVLLYYVDEEPRNNVGSFKTYKVEGTQSDKDKVVAHHCDVGLCYWNGSSAGVQANINRLERMEKPCKVIIEEPEEGPGEEENAMADIKPSAKMKKGIKIIEENLHIKYTGKTFDDAKKFLDENLPKLNDIDFRESKSPSEKQLKGIHFIESMLGVQFTGSSMKDASDFLDEYFDQAKQKSGYLKEHKKK